MAASSAVRPPRLLPTRIAGVSPQVSVMNAESQFPRNFAP